jgi:hypothetical protein
MYASGSSTDADVTYDVRINTPEDRPATPPVVHVHTSYHGPYLALSVLEARRLVAALTGALEEHDATREFELSMARLEARKRIGAGE